MGTIAVPIHSRRCSVFGLNEHSVSTIDGPVTDPQTMQDFSNMLQQDSSISPSYFNGLIIKVILLGREKSEGIWSSVHQFAYATVMIISQLCFGGEAAPQRMGTEVWAVSLYHVVYLREETPGLVFISETKQADQSPFLFTTQCA